MMLDVAEQVSKGFNMQHCHEAHQIIQHAVATALQGASMLDLMQPWVRQLLAQHKLLLLSLDQYAQADLALRAEQAYTSGPLGGDSLQLSIPATDLTWQDGLQQASAALAEAQQAQQASWAASGKPSKAQGAEANTDFYNLCPASQAFLPLRLASHPELNTWWKQYACQTDQHARGDSDRMPAVCVRDLLMALGMPQAEALDLQGVLQPSQIFQIMEVMLPSRRQHLLSYLRRHFGGPDLVCGSLSKPEELPSQQMQWVSVSNDCDRAALAHFLHLPTLIARSGRTEDGDVHPGHVSVVDGDGCDLRMYYLHRGQLDFSKRFQVGPSDAAKRQKTFWRLLGQDA